MAITTGGGISYDSGQALRNFGTSMAQIIQNSQKLRQDQETIKNAQAQLDLQRQNIDEQARQFGLTHGLSVEQLAAQIKQFETTADFNKTQLGEQTRQFDVSAAQTDTQLGQAGQRDALSRFTMLTKEIPNIAAQMGVPTAQFLTDPAGSTYLGQIMQEYSAATGKAFSPGDADLFATEMIEFVNDPNNMSALNKTWLALQQDIPGGTVQAQSGIVAPAVGGGAAQGPAEPEAPAGRALTQEELQAELDRKLSGTGALIYTDEMRKAEAADAERRRKDPNEPMRQFYYQMNNGTDDLDNLPLDLQAKAFVDWLGADKYRNRMWNEYIKNNNQFPTGAFPVDPGTEVELDYQAKLLKAERERDAALAKAATTGALVGTANAPPTTTPGTGAAAVNELIARGVPAKPIQGPVTAPRVVQQPQAVGTPMTSAPITGTPMKSPGEQKSEQQAEAFYRANKGVSPANPEEAFRFVMANSANYGEWVKDPTAFERKYLQWSPSSVEDTPEEQAKFFVLKNGRNPVKGEAFPFANENAAEFRKYRANPREYKIKLQSSKPVSILRPGATGSQTEDQIWKSSFQGSPLVGSVVKANFRQSNNPGSALDSVLGSSRVTKGVMEALPVEYTVPLEPVPSVVEAAAQNVIATGQKIVNGEPLTMAEQLKARRDAAIQGNWVNSTWKKMSDTQKLDAVQRMMTELTTLDPEVLTIKYLGTDLGARRAESLQREATLRSAAASAMAKSSGSENMTEIVNLIKTMNETINSANDAVSAGMATTKLSRAQFLTENPDLENQLRASIKYRDSLLGAMGVPVVTEDWAAQAVKKGLFSGLGSLFSGPTSYKIVPQSGTTLGAQTPGVGAQPSGSKAASELGSKYGAAVK